MSHGRLGLPPWQRRLPCESRVLRKALADSRSTHLGRAPLVVQVAQGGDVLVVARLRGPQQLRVAGRAHVLVDGVALLGRMGQTVVGVGLNAVYVTATMCRYGSTWPLARWEGAGPSGWPRAARPRCLRVPTPKCVTSVMRWRLASLELPAWWACAPVCAKEEHAGQEAQHGGAAAPHRERKGVVVVNKRFIYVNYLL